jgi:hypothetical protein
MDGALSAGSQPRLTPASRVHAAKVDREDADARRGGLADADPARAGHVRGPHQHQERQREPGARLDRHRQRDEPDPGRVLPAEREQGARGQQPDHQQVVVARRRSC